MLRASPYSFTIEPYSEFAWFEGTVAPDVVQRGFDTLLFSPRSVSAMMLRVLVVVPVLLVTQSSTRLIFTPVVRFGKVRMPAS